MASISGIARPADKVMTDIADYVLDYRIDSTVA